MNPLAAAVVLSLLAAEDEAGRMSPDALVIAGHRVHVHASEELHPDALAGLARPGVTLWLHTRSNALFPATVERLRRFSEAWVQLRAPVLPAHALSLSRAPNAGVWLRDARARPKDVARLGVRRVAVDVSGAFDDGAADRVQGASRVQWVPHELDVDGFGRFLQLRATGAVVLAANAAVPTCDVAAEATARATFVVDTLEAALAAARCGAKVRLRVDPGVPNEVLVRLFRASPDAQLEVHVGADQRKAMRTRQLLERLEAASGSVMRRRQTR